MQQKSYEKSNSYTPPPNNKLKLGILFALSALLLLFSFSQTLRLGLIQSAPRALNVEFWDFWIQSRAIFFLCFLALFIFLERFSLDFLKNKNAPFVFYAVILILFHFFMPFVGDDIYYSKALENTSLIDWLIERYNHWSSRIFIDFVTVIFASLPYYTWKIFNIFIFLYLAFGLNKLLNSKNNPTFLWLIIFLLCIYPFYQLSSAGWIATICNYALPAIGLVSISCFLQKIYKEQKTTNLDYFTLFAGFLFTTSQEQSALILLIFLCAFLYFCNKDRKLVAFLLFLNIVLLCVILFAPGNYERLHISIKDLFPAFADFNIFQKISLGILNTANLFLKDKFLLLILCFTLFILTFKNFKEKHLKILASIQLLICLALNVLDIIFKSLQTLRIFMQQYGLIPDLSFYFILSLVLVIILFLIILYLVLRLSKNNYIFLFIFIVGLFSKAIMGFSPTIYASGERTGIFAYLAMIALVYHFIQMIVEEFSPKILEIIFKILILFSLINVLDNFWGMSCISPIRISYVDQTLLFLCALFFVFQRKSHFPRST